MKSSTALKFEEKKLVTVTSALGGLLIVMLAVCIYGTFKNGIDFMTFLPIFFLPMLLINIFKIRKLRKEINERE
jgi:hypothetical protein